jgi:hypothetical protein
MPARPWATLALLAAALATAAVPGLAATLGYEPGVAAWRLFSSQLAHWDGDHLLWDALAVAILGWWAESRWPGRTRLALGLGILAVPLATTAVHPDLAYRGLSGLACTLAAVGALCAWQDARRARDGVAALVAAGLLAGLVLKTAYELATGDAVFATAAGWIPLPVAHLIGIACGLTAALATTCRTRLLETRHA